MPQPCPPETTTLLTDSLTLPNGVVLANRLVKAATSEHLATRLGAPTRQLIEAYRALISSGTGLLISGNVMVDGAALEASRNVVIEDDRDLAALQDWAQVTQGSDAKLILQLSHPGRQTMRGMSVAGRRQDVVAPSAVALAVGGGLAFRAPRELAESEIEDVIARFATAAGVAARAGFAGVEIHAAHGYLISQFLSPLVNRRTDNWGGTLENRMRLLLEIVRAVDAATPESFIVAVKMNSADFQRGGFGRDDAIGVARALEAAGIDLLEISGGTYENATMISGRPQRASTAAREAYFIEFAEEFATELTIPLMLSGGFRSRAGMIAALESGVDLIGLARPITHDPDFTRRLLSGSAEASREHSHSIGNRTVDDLLNGSWHQQQLARLGRAKPVASTRAPLVALVIGLLVMLRDGVAAALPAFGPQQ
jgi:2,4-dienoyl-CoA reductase-like NADH-dependent reductase (Old Yellow Enzyme family)